MTQAILSKGKRKRVLKTTAERQREILDVTIRLLAEYGVHGTTVARIADAVGMSKGALYYHFSNREALLAAALEAMDETATAWIARPPREDTPARLLAMGEAHSQWTLSAYHTFIRPFYQLISSNREPSLTALITAKTRHYFEFLAECAEEGKREGTIRSDVDSREVAWSVLQHAWGEDIARLIGIDEYVTEGMSSAILKRLMDAYAVAPPVPDEDQSRAEQQKSTQ